MKAEWTNSDSLTTSQTTKAIVMTDVPMLDDGRHLCNECPIWNDEHCFCQYDFNMKAKGCPLRPLPSFKAVDLNDTRDVVMFCHGWNTCLNEITGETE